MPQASCSRYPLQIGAFSILLVKLFMYVLFIFKWPLATLLDYALGAELGTIYTTTGSHAEHPRAAGHGRQQSSPSRARCGIRTWRCSCNDPDRRGVYGALFT